MVYGLLVWIEQTAMPAFQVSMLPVLGIGDSVEEPLEAGDAAYIFGWGPREPIKRGYSAAESVSATVAIVIVCRPSSPKS